MTKRFVGNFLPAISDFSFRVRERRASTADPFQIQNGAQSDRGECWRLDLETIDDQDMGMIR